MTGHTPARPSGRPAGLPLGPPPVDNASKAIIEQLQEDGRRSYAAIGKAVGLSEAAVRQRVQRAIDDGTMEIIAVTNPMQLGFTRQAMVGIKVQGNILPVADALAEMAEINYVVVTAGRFDIITDIVCVNDELMRVINELIRNLPGVSSAEAVMYLSLRKQKYNWGTR